MISNSSTYALYTATFPWCNLSGLFFGTSHIKVVSISIIESLATISISGTRAIPCLIGHTPYKHTRAKLIMKKAQNILVSVPLVFNAQKGGSELRDFPTQFNALKSSTLVALLYMRHKSVIQALQNLHYCINFGAKKAPKKRNYRRTNVLIWCKKSA